MTMTDLPRTAAGLALLDDLFTDTRIFNRESISERILAIEAEVREPRLREVLEAIRDRAAKEHSLTIFALAEDALAAPSGSAPPEKVYLPMDCPICGRHRMEWDDKVLSCEKCSTSSEWDGFTADRYQADERKATVERIRAAVHGEVGTDPLVAVIEVNRILDAEAAR